MNQLVFSRPQTVTRLRLILRIAAAGTLLAAMGLGYQLYAASSAASRLVQEEKTALATYRSMREAAKSEAARLASETTPGPANLQFPVWAADIQARCERLALQISDLKANDEPVPFVDPFQSANTGWVALPCNLTVVGDYRDLMTLLEELGRSSAIIEFSSVELSRVALDLKEQKSVVQLRLNLMLLAPASGS